MLPFIALADVVDVSPPAQAVMATDPFAPRTRKLESESSAELPHVRVWYGLPMLVIDGSAALLSIGVPLALSTDGAITHPENGYLVAAGGLTYLLGGPIVHAVHGHPWRGLGSLGLRAAAPTGGALLGLGIAAAINPCAREASCTFEFLALSELGLLAGAAGAMLVDDLVLARDTVPAPSATKSAAFFTWQPSMSFVREGNSRAPVLGISGTF